MAVLRITNSEQFYCVILLIYSRFKLYLLEELAEVEQGIPDNNCRRKWKGIEWYDKGKIYDKPKTL